MKFAYIYLLAFSFNIFSSENSNVEILELSSQSQDDKVILLQSALKACRQLTESEQDWIGGCEYLRNSNEEFVLAIENENVVGVASVSNSECRIKQFFVSSDVRGKGVANKLIRYVKYVQLANCAKVSLYAHRDNNRAIAFYRKNEFSTTPCSFSLCEYTFCRFVDHSSK